MDKRRIAKYDKEEIEFEGLMRLVAGIVLHILDKVSVSNKWKNKDISMKTLLAKKETLEEMRKWMNAWQWGIWVGIYAEYNNFNSKMIKKR